MERRSELRLKRDLACAVYTDEGEFPGRIVDVSREGLAFEAEPGIGLGVSDSLMVSICDSYQDMLGDKKLFSENVKGTVKNVIPTDDNKVRYGCFIHNWAYQSYLQDLYMANACGKLKE